MHRNALFGILLMLLLTAAVAAEPKITVDHRQPTVKTRLFDPDNRPPDMPAFTGEEAAYCSYNLGASAAVSYSLRTSSDGKTCEAAWAEITLTLTCDIVIWLPHNFTPKLKAHEEAHRQIAETVYAASKPLARQLASDLARSRLKLDPRRCRESAEEAANAASNRICDQWLKVTGQRASAINDAFDKITDHGRNAIPEDQAIEQAFRQVDTKAAPSAHE